MNSGPSKAAQKALKEASELFPGRSTISDGIMGDTAHQQRKSDHNDGNAFDLTHDPAKGCDCEALKLLAINDPRVTYVIFRGQIWNNLRGDTAWRAYEGTNPHNAHMHVSIRAESRDDESSWWLPSKPSKMEAGMLGKIFGLPKSIIWVTAFAVIMGREFLKKQ